MYFKDIPAEVMYKMCLHKRRYKTLEKAERAAKFMTDKYGKIQTPYYCPVCQAYHLTTHQK